ncbi:hypothetical protein [Micromonospora cathayae]|uniref:Uncharacterized protein n=1 Tax=Micromonospora cathayae TaxID=3028804 RepID=A0ABY7ZVW6_9ACTN|nr:hypothetical protein [Micromonospora sp. HUAS 3]WDZ87201.1 hypothetical protein PVK37_12735 [Micromonospora sp. HUAS 3]
MTPHHLHAVRTTWALHTALTRLGELAVLESRLRTDETLSAADGLRSPLYGQRHATGGHSDPVSATLTLHDATARVTRWADLSQRATDRLRWIADMIGATPAPDPWWRIHTRTPRLPAATAATITRHLADEDTWIRAAVRLAPAGQPLTGVPCPRCGVRQLQVHTDGPEASWTVTCTCICVGQGCACGMDGKVEGVQHIWPRHQVLGRIDA